MRTHDYQYAFDHSIIFPDTSRNPLDPSAYNFHTTDSCIADILNAGGKVYYRFGQSFDMSHTHNKPPYDYNKWAQVCLQTIKHYNDGWNSGFNYDLDYFEIWNEPDLKEFWTGTADDYVKLYRTTARMIKQYDANLKVGGPAISNVFNEDFTNKFLDSVKTENIPLDFFSYHLYYHFNPWYFKFVNEYARKKLINAGLGTVELVNSEWNSYLYSFDTPNYYGMDDALNAASLTGAMIYMQSSTIGKFFRYALDNYLFGMVDWNDEWRYSGLAMRSVRQLMNGNSKIVASGGDSLGTAIIASKSAADYDVNVIITDNSSSANGYKINFSNLPHNYRYNIYRIDKNYKYELVENGTLWTSSGEIKQKVSTPYSDFIQLEEIMGVENYSSDNKVLLYPNPANDFIRIEGLEYSDYNYSVINSIGTKVIEGRLKSKNKCSEISVRNLEEGIYIIIINSGLNNYCRMKFIKK
jgi:hypothetical protein